MSTIAEIETAIASLPPQEFSELGKWFDGQRQARWDAQMVEDANAGRLDFLSEELDEYLAKGETRPLNEVLRHS